MTPHPDYLVLADTCEDYEVRSEFGNSEVNIFNPGNFAKEKSFALLYPHANKIELSSL